MSRHEDFLLCRDESKNGARSPAAMCRGADAVVRDVCEAIVVDGENLTRPKQVVCQPMSVSQGAEPVEAGLHLTDWHQGQAYPFFPDLILIFTSLAAKAEKAINAPGAGVVELQCSVLVRANQGRG
ncbi:hypothetical protein [Pseudomonas sp. P9_31]|uniref:hypothetical protein n=1 Tax=Pseudomonas sp. P9_31 TaxID=3043448 RepID=UPI002A3602B9|nr:hypothetical protein [Pseudomonas sp. P9_31]WPN60440.1 hypothetical protein QMK51_12940 [Pseudomonas sp. P9_31]